jgi:hypothetical protein
VVVPLAAAPLFGAPPEPDMCVHLCPGVALGAVDGFAAGLAACAAALPGNAVLPEDSVRDEARDVAGEPVEALAMVSPNASAAPRAAAPTAVPMRGLVILTRSPFVRSPEPDPGDPAVPVGRASLTGLCAHLLKQR